jgi:chromosome partitioning protein
LACVLIANAPIKGGVSKSTLSVHLIGWLATRGRTVALVNGDPQRSSTKWVQTALPNVPCFDWFDADTIFDEVPKLVKQYDVVVADGSGNNSEISRSLLSLADVAMLPCKAGQLELDSLDQTIRVLRQVQQVRKGPPEASVILTQVQERFLLTRSRKEQIEAYDVAVASRVMTYRQIYADAPGQGKLVWDMHEEDPRAAVAATEELHAIFAELFGDLARPAPRRHFLRFGSKK